MTSKRLLLIVVATWCLLSARAQGEFKIEGQLQGAENKKVMLYRGDDKHQIVDSAIVKNGGFVFAGVLNTPCEYAMLLLGDVSDNHNNTQWQLALEPGTTTIKGSLFNGNDVLVSGGKTQTELNGLNEELKPLMQQLVALNNEYGAAHTQTERDAIQARMEPIAETYKQRKRTFYQTHPNSYLSPQYLMEDMNSMSYQKLLEIYEGFSEQVKQWGWQVSAVKKELDILARVQPGMVAPDFTATDINGKPFTLSKLKGKVVIVDFWASWCVPCRKSNPHMRQLHNKYHKKGLELVYVSDDDNNPAAWRKAVLQDALAGEGYHHVLRGLKWDRSKGSAGMDHTNDISDKYAIHLLPTKYLIDRDGRIVCKIGEAENERLDQLIEKLL